MSKNDMKRAIYQMDFTPDKINILGQETDVSQVVII